ncbi:MAG: monovalent cation/hydrogen antiporter [Gaiellaceae bacterium]|nr:monovalent cation/hydrogen antiporter [Gaiellaceae bacterium]
MHFTAHNELQLLILLAALAAMLVVAAVGRLPPPLLFVSGGLALGFVPGLPHFQLAPDIVLVAILPPLLYSSAFFTGLRDLRTNLRPITLLAIGLVAATTCTVAVVAHAVVSGLSWGEAFTLGAVVSPTDALAAREVIRRVNVPRRIVSIIEGESLVNDGFALVLYKSALGAAVAGTFSLWSASWHLIVNVIGGIAVGLAVGYLVRQVRRRVDDAPTEVALALLSGYLAYLPAAAIGVSGVLAAVTIGVYMGWYTPQLTNGITRISGNAFWEIVTFVVNALLFALVGLQLHPILNRLSGRSTISLIGDAAVVSVVVIVTRILWVPVFTYVPRALFRRVRERDPYPPWQAPVIISWAGIRGAVSLAAALALPTNLPGRDLIVFLTFAVILVTLVGQGLTLPFLVRRLGVEDDGGADREDAKARIKAAEAALERLEELEAEGWVREDTAERTRGTYRFRTSRFTARYHGNDDDGTEERSQQYQRLRRELLEAERQAVLRLRNEGTITEDVMQRVQRDIDLEDLRLDV